MKRIFLCIALGLASVSYADEIVTLPDVIVTAQPQVYVANTPAAVGSHLEEKPIDTPRNIVEITGDTIEAQGDKTLNSVMQNVSGIGFNSNLSGNRSNPMIRGFTLDEHYGIKVDGMYNLSWEDYDMFNVAEVQVLKGPNAGAMGMGDPGGFVNYVTKKPQWGEPTFELQQTVGNYGYWNTSAAFTTPINDSIASRTVISISDGANPALNGTTDKKREFFDQMFTVKLAPSSTLDLDFRHQYDNQNYGATSELPAVGNGPAPIPIRTNMASPNDQFRVNDDSYAARLKTELGDNWTMNNSVKYQTVDRLRQYLNPSALSNAGVLSTSYYWQDQQMNYTTVDTNFVNKDTIAGMKNTVVFGVDYMLNTTNALTQSNSTKYYINIYDPNFTGFTWKYGNAVNSNAQQSDFGQYIQDELFITDRLILNAGVRHDVSPQSSSSAPSATDSATSPSVGLTYKLTPTWSVYTDYATSFNPQTQTTTSYVPPQTSKQYEAGTKWIDPEKGVRLNAAVYSLTLNNVATPDPTNATLTDYTGQVRNNGFELDGAYDITHHWTVLANYAYIDSKITQDTLYAGNQMASIPPVTYGGWLMYHTYEWGAGVGVRHVSQRYGDNANDFVLPEYTTFSANAYYQVAKDVKISANIDNITNQQYYLGASTRYSILQGNPMTARVTLNYTF